MIHSQHHEGAPRLLLRAISKRYPSVVANDAIDLEVRPGEIHALLGENGAGKSTLMKIVYGVVRPDAGQVEWEGSLVHIGSPAQARQLGIGMVFQHFALFETLTVAENIALALDERIAPAQLAPRIRAVSAEYGLPLEPERLVHSMSVGERQRVEIVRCLLQSPRLLIMDEPTSVLTPDAVQTLFGALRRLAAEGCSILYISHKLDEIRELCDRATVLRGGRVAGHALPRQESAHSLAQLMTGAELPECHLTPREPGPVRLALTGLTVPSLDPFGTTLSDISLEVRAGEIVGIAGISGNGQQELMRAISGEAPHRQAGAVMIDGADVASLDAAQRRARGLCFVPEERLGRGAVPDLPLTANALLTGYASGLVRRGLIDTRLVRDFARKIVTRFQVKCASEHAAAGSLSGGNLQKFIVGREMLLQPKVLLLAQPTWGVDVGAAMLIRQAAIDLRDQGVAVLVLSEELEELFMMCDRIAVLAGGRLSPAMATADTSPRDVGVLMSGQQGERHAAA